MRLSTFEIQSILDIFHKTFGDEKVYLFGSRLDDSQKGGDIDLYFEVDIEEKLHEKKIDFLVQLQNKIIVQETLISIRQHEKEDFISLTDIAIYKDSDRSDYILQNWMRNIESKSLEWNLSRSLSKINYKIHTDAIKEHLIPDTISKPKEGFVYANEADILNMATKLENELLWKADENFDSGIVKTVEWYLSKYKI